MTYHDRQDETTEWLNYLQPEGLVVGPNVLREKGLTPIRQGQLDTVEVAQAIAFDPDAAREDDKHFALHDAWAFFETVLRWPATHVAGSPGGPAVPSTLTVTVPEHETLLTPDLAILWNGDAPDGVPAQALVMLHPTLDADARNQFASSEWEASPHQRLERLLRETNVGVGILVARNTLRLVYAPRGETAGWLSWPLAALARVEGRPMLAGLKLCLGRTAFFIGAEETRLRTLLAASRAAQNAVSGKLSGQVLGALHELLRGLHRAAPERIEALAQNEPHHLYEGLLTCLMRLVFLLYAEDRDLLPSSADPKLKQLWENGYSIKTLYARLMTDEALNPDTMDERRGGWGQLLAVFRIIHQGYPGWVKGRGGKLFDPDIFPFIEGRDVGSTRNEAQVLPLSDGSVLRILHGLMTIEGRSLGGEKIRERLSYRSLDVESIGSVYETVMGFTAARADEAMIALRDEKKLPTFIGLHTLLAQKPNDRQKWLKERAIKLSAKQATAVKGAGDVAALVEAFGNLVDERGSPKAAPSGAGAPYLQPTEERRRTGSHYTPRSLTAPIVKHALEPAFARLGPDATPEQVLELKVCDPAMGSGAFLVEACRALGERLVAAWARWPSSRPKIPADEDEELHARRLVAQRCLYGVDKNPRAVDLARLSLWLATLARDHEFTFLDHALKCGDSLVGLTTAQIAAANWDESKPGLPLFRQLVRDKVAKAMQGRAEIQNAPDDTMRAIQEARHRNLESEVSPIRIMGDAVVSAFFAADKGKAREKARADVESHISGMPPRWDLLETAAARLRAGEHDVTPFHWQVEFPEVFARENGGFDAIVGNPPFAGKNTIIAGSAKNFLPWLQTLHEGAHGNADLVAHFFRRAFGLLRQGGVSGLIATNTIGQGDTRASGLTRIIADGGAISRATRRLKWPGEAAVVVSVVHIVKGEVAAPVLDTRPVRRISAYLVEGDLDTSPVALAANSGKAFQGSIVLGMGFTFDDVAAAKGEAESLDTMRALIAKNPRNAERIFPFIGWKEVASSEVHSHSRFAIDFFDRPLARDQNLSPWLAMDESTRAHCRGIGIVPEDYPDEVAEEWPDLIEIIRRRVKPDRDGQTRDALRQRWWQYAEKRPGLYGAIARLEHVFVTSSQAASHILFARLGVGRVYSSNLNVIANERFAKLALLQARSHELWAQFFGSTVKDDPTYTIKLCFRTFPFPINFEADAALEVAGEAYHAFRAQLMIARNEGLTKTYNRFHARGEIGADIARLRALHHEMDVAVLRAYARNASSKNEAMGWDDLAARAAPEFIEQEADEGKTPKTRLDWPSDFKDEVLARLLALNATRAAEERAAGLVPADEGDDDEIEDGEE